MRIGLLHGWLLTGSGSNIYVQNVARSLWKQGHDVHIFCQDRNATKLPFVSTVEIHSLDGNTVLDEARSEGISIHIPEIGGVLPVFVWDSYPSFDQVIEFPNLSSAQLQRYVDTNVGIISAVAEKHGLEILHANHAVMMPEIARQVQEKTSIPYVVALHGSGLVYAVERSPKCLEYALRGIRGARAVLVGNNYFRSRVLEVFENSYPEIESKAIKVPLGVDTDLFTPLTKEPAAILAKLRSYQDGFDGRTQSQSKQVHSLFDSDIMDGRVPTAIFDIAKEYSQKSPDRDLIAKLEGVDWSQPVVIFVGRLILGKGPHDLLLAFSELAERTPCHLIVVGAGPIREWLELYVRLRKMGINSMAESWLDTARALPDSESLLATANEWIADMSTHWNPLPEMKVTFTGFMDHNLLRLLLPMADVAVFPSLIPESFGLVALEAASAGVVPLVSDFSGLRDSAITFEQRIDSLQDGVLRFPRDPPRRIETLVKRMESAIAHSRRKSVTQSLRSVVEDIYSWDAVAQSLVSIYSSLDRINAQS